MDIFFTLKAATPMFYCCIPANKSQAVGQDKVLVGRGSVSRQDVMHDAATILLHLQVINS
jgi:hypothetical protein